MTMNTEQTDRHSYVYNLDILRLSNKCYCVQADETMKAKRITFKKNNFHSPDQDQFSQYL